MATTTYLTNPAVFITPAGGSQTEMTDQCTSAAIMDTRESLEITAFGDTGRQYSAGLQNPEVTLTMFVSYGATEVEGILAACVGKRNDITIAPAAGNATVGNPVYTVTGAYLESFEPITGSVGELSTVDVTFTGGSISRNTGA